MSDLSERCRSSDSRSHCYCNVPSLKSMDSPPYGLKTVHYVLKRFHLIYDYKRILDECLKVKNYQAAAKICLLQGQITQSLSYHLEALRQTSQSDDSTKITDDDAIFVVRFYLGIAPKRDHLNNKTLLEHILKFWLEENLPIANLESLLIDALDVVMYPLTLIMLCGSPIDKTNNTEEFDDKRNNLLSRLSAKFCLALTTHTVATISEEEPRSQLIMLMSKCENAVPVKSEADVKATASSEQPSLLSSLWHRLIHGKSESPPPDNHRDPISSHTITLTFQDVDRLRQKIQLKASTDSQSDCISFSCGHIFPWTDFHDNSLPAFEKDLTMLFSESKKTILEIVSELSEEVSCADVIDSNAAARNLSENFQEPGYKSGDCPRCLLAKIKFISR